MSAVIEAKKIDWEDIVDSIRDQKCVLFIGPSTICNATGETLEELINRDEDLLAESKEQVNSKYLDGFVTFRGGSAKRKYVKEYTRSLERCYPELQETLHKLARIPLGVIVSLSPDNLLIKAYEDLQLDYFSDYYRKEDSNLEETAAHKDSPLVYNLLGNVNEWQSVVMTHNDLFNYLEHAFTAKNKLNAFRKKLLGTNYLIFLGMPYEKWYLQLLLRLLNLHDEDLTENLEKLASKPKQLDQEKSDGDKKIVNIYADQFHIKYAPYQTSEFISELFDQCDKAGILRQASAAKKEVKPRDKYDDVKDNIGINKMDEAFDTLEAIVKDEDNELFNALITIKSRYTTYDYDKLKGKKPDESILNTIKDDLLNLTDLVKENFPDS